MLARVVQRRFRGYAGSGLLERRRRERVTAPAPFSSSSLLGARTPRWALGLPGRRCGGSVRDEQKSVLSNRGARTAIPGFGSPVARFASLPWGCPILSHSGQTIALQHTQALSSIFASNFLSSFPGLPIEERWRGVAPRYALPLPVDSEARVRGLPSVRDQWGGQRGIRQDITLCGRSVEEVREEQKSVLSNRGARGAFRDSAFRLPGQRASLWHSILSHSGQAHHTACASIVKHRKAPMSKLKRNGSPASATALRASV